MDTTGLFLFIFVYSTNLTLHDKSIDGVLGIRTQEGRMVGVDECTELWLIKFSAKKLKTKKEYFLSLFPPFCVVERRVMQQKQNALES